MSFAWPPVTKETRYYGNTGKRENEASRALPQLALLLSPGVAAATVLIFQGGRGLTPQNHASSQATGPRPLQTPSHQCLKGPMPRTQGCLFTGASEVPTESTHRQHPKHHSTVTQNRIAKCLHALQPRGPPLWLVLPLGLQPLPPRSAPRHCHPCSPDAPLLFTHRPSAARLPPPLRLTPLASHLLTCSSAVIVSMEGP